MKAINDRKRNYVSHVLLNSCKSNVYYKDKDMNNI